MDIVLGIVINNNKVLLIKRVKKEKTLEWAFPGGKVEEDETKEQAVLREVKEETNIDCRIIKQIDAAIHPLTGANITYFLCKALNSDLKIQETEVTEVALKKGRRYII